MSIDRLQPDAQTHRRRVGQAHVLASWRAGIDVAGAVQGAVKRSAWSIAPARTSP